MDKSRFEDRHRPVSGPYRDCMVDKKTGIVSCQAEEITDINISLRRIDIGVELNPMAGVGLRRPNLALGRP